jgi:crotonobetainyl-CoA:carnitine CoA-transferase CaiB-like acyl-CoA transferase
MQERRFEKIRKLNRDVYTIFTGLVWSNVQGLTGMVNAAVADTETRRLVSLGAKAELAAQHIATVADALRKRMAANESTTEDEDYDEPAM